MTLPLVQDRMPRDPSPEPPYSPARLIALALSTVDVKWAGHILGEQSIPVRQVLDVLKQGGWKIVPMERGDYGK